MIVLPRSSARGRPRPRWARRGGSAHEGKAIIRSGRSKLLTAAVVVGVLTALVPAVPAIAAVSAHSPPPGSAAMAYDAADGLVVLFGGTEGDTWTWDGTDWTKQTTAHSPPPGSEGMAYDDTDGQVVLFGGRTSAAFLGDTWTWGGTDWTKRTPAHSPLARSDMGIAYDAADGLVVLFGGACGTPCGDSWTWDGTDWTQRPAGSISLSQRSGPPGVFVSVEGWSFAVVEHVKLYFVDSSQGPTLLTKIQANAAGGFGTVVSIPVTATPGGQRVKARGATSGQIATVPFEVT